MRELDPGACAFSVDGHGKMSVAVRDCACNERGSACMCVEYAGSFIYHYEIYGSTRLMAAFYSKE